MEVQLRFSDATTARLKFWTDVVEHYEELLRAEIIGKRVDSRTHSLLFHEDSGRLLLIEARERVRAMSIPEEVLIEGDGVSQRLFPGCRTLCGW